MRFDRRRLRWPVIGLATLAVLGTGTAYAVTGNDATASYRTVAATISDVEETLATTGSVDSANRADLGFGTDGTVAKLFVAEGDSVKAGQAIGKLDTTDLDAALTQAKAEYARAVAQLASDEDAQASAVSDQSSTPSDTGSTPSGSSTPTGNDQSSAATARLLKALRKAQGQVIVAQSHASQAIAAAKQALAAQQAACAPSPTATATATATPTDSPTDDGSGDDCDAALAAVQQAQDVVSQAQDDLAKALDALGKVLSQALGTVQGSQTPAHAKAAVSDASTPSSDGSDQQSSSPSSNGATGQTVTAAQLASDQAKIEEAQASVIAAQQNLAQATLRSTRSGTVVALDTAVGDQVTAGSTVATVVGGNAVTITATVSESQVDSVKVGQTVRVSVPGISKKTTGKVTAIGLVADSSTGTTSYPVTVTVEDPTISLPAGSRASIQIVLETAKDVVTVPTSAVTRSGSGTTATVSTWNGSTLTRKTVQLGAVGSRTVAISSGLSAGTRVVLANVDQAIKGAATSVNNRGNFQFPAGGTFRAPAGGNGGPVTFSRGG
ncbi:efflux RND transporter periplasmic adaptor subunit [Nocardioides marmorisolisilvae]|uniref:Efflux RND transporter periplasmic adaptor subunit n=1 Tax=Nocardioides marmorisolisilvae TaxID=1542737 RepID=A0A3N0DST6_9ACTN|nr:efflux RND transporter periplasmic adaptor subunit [Nocardioides marmorisolisilvae]RNL78670.1 efflux RND transporter periplasmic adaptor subunit [Nocardioides marmorisolisilvae]